MNAVDQAFINADAGGFALTVAVKPSGGNGATVSAGIAVANNTITNSVTARVSGATVDAKQDVAVTATSSKRIAALTVSVAASIDVTIGEGANAAVAVVYQGATNTIGGSVEASVKPTTTPGSIAKVTAGRDARIEATDTSTIAARFVAVNVAVEIGVGEGVSFAAGVGVTLSTNTVSTDVTATVLGGTVEATGAASVKASSTRDLAADVVSVGVTVALQISEEPVSFAFDVVYVSVENEAGGTTTANIADGGKLTGNSGVLVDARDNSTLDSSLTGVSVSLGLIAAAASVVRASTRSRQPYVPPVDGSTAGSSNGGVTSRGVDRQHQAHRHAERCGVRWRQRRRNRPARGGAHQRSDRCDGDRRLDRHGRERHRLGHVDR